MHACTRKATPVYMCVVNVRMCVVIAIAIGGVTLTYVHVHVRVHGQ